MKIEEFIKKHDIRFDCRPVNQRPDGVSDATKAHYQCIIGNRNNLLSFRLYISQKVDAPLPTVETVLHSLAQNAAEYEPLRPKLVPDQLLLWCANMGYKVDSRRAEKEFRAMKRQVNQLRRTVGIPAFNELIAYTHSGDVKLDVKLDEEEPKTKKENQNGNITRDR